MNKNIFSKKLRELIKTKGITQKELAGYLNFSPETVSKYCRGDSEPSIDVMLKISKYFNVTLDELVSDTKNEEYISPLALSVQNGIYSFYEFIKKDKKNILKKDDSNKDFIDYLIKYKKFEELFDLIEWCFSRKEAIQYKNKNLQQATCALIEDIYNNAYYNNHKGLINHLYDENYTTIINRLKMTKSEALEKVKDSESFNEYIKPTIDSVYKELNSDFSFAKVPEVIKKLSDKMIDIIKLFIKNRYYDFAIKTDEYITDKNQRIKVIIKSENYKDFQLLLIKNKAPIEKVKYFSQFRKGNGLIYENYLIEVLKKDKQLLDEYRTTVFNNFNRRVVNNSELWSKLAHYTLYTFKNKLNEDIIELYELLFNHYYLNFKQYIDENKSVHISQFYNNYTTYIRQIDQLKKYCLDNNEENLWNTIINNEIAQKVLNANTYGFNYYGEEDHRIIVSIKKRYNFNELTK